MNKAILLILLLLLLVKSSTLENEAFAKFFVRDVPTPVNNIEFHLERHCRDVVMGKFNETKVLHALNTKIKKVLDSKGARVLFTIEYLEDTSGVFRNTENACIIGIAWFSK